MYQGSEAYSLNVPERVQPLHSSRPSLEVVEGRGLDARARSGVSRSFVTKLAVAGAVLAVFAALCVARVAIFSSAVGVLSENSEMRTEIKEAQDTQDDLRVTRSVLSSTSRIDRIAQQSYGMVPAGTEEQMVASASSGSDDGFTTGSDDAAASDSTGSAQGTGAAGLDGVAMVQGDGSTAGANAADID